jgi:hypothetical protein
MTVVARDVIKGKERRSRKVGDPGQKSLYSSREGSNC